MRTQSYDVREVLYRVKHLTQKIGIPVCIDWRSREVFSQRVADLLTRVINLHINAKKRVLIQQRLGLSVFPLYQPFLTKDFLVFRPGIFSTITNCHVIIPPHLGRRNYNRIIEFFTTEWQTSLILIFPWLPNLAKWNTLTDFQFFKKKKENKGEEAIVFYLLHRWRPSSAFFYF